MQIKASLLKYVAALALVCVSQAHAGLLGSTVTSQYYAYGGTYNSGGSPAVFIANGTAQTSFFTYFSLTVTDNQVVYDFLSDVTWSSSGTSLNSNGLFITNGNLLSFMGASPIANVTMDPASRGGSGVTFNANNIAIDWQNISFRQGDQVILNVSAVPEPGTYALMFAGLAIVGAAASRRKKTA